MVTTLSVNRLAELQDEDERVAVVDTRPADSYDGWHITGAKHFPFGPEEELDDRLEELRELVSDHDRLVTICAKAISSANLATQLESATDEFDIAVVEGGMKAWSGVYDRAEVDTGDRSPLRIIQVQRRAKGCLGYVIGCAETGAAILVDVTDDVQEFERAALEAEMTVTGVIDTHVHADHVSGGKRLADRLEVPYYLGEHAADRDVKLDFTPLERNEVLEVGTLNVKALYTPGHTSDMLSILVDGEAVLTADTLHADSTGRTELEFGDDEGERGAKLLYESLHRTILALPEDVLVLPGHVAVSSDGRFSHGSPGDPIATTVGEARTGIDVLGLDESAFVDRLAAAGEKPANYEEIIALNRGARDEPPEDRVELELGPNNCSA